MWESARGGGPRLRLVMAIAVLSLCAGCNTEPPHPTVHISSKPENGVPILINGQPVGDTPFTINMEPGSRLLVSVEHPQYVRYQSILEAPDEAESEFVLELESRLGYVNFESDPAFAEIVLDGKVIGQTPLENAPVPVGERNYVLRLKDHVPELGTFTVEQDNKYTRTHVMTPMDATLHVSSSPARATVFINDTPQKKLTPGSYSLPPGNYRVSVYTKGYISSEDLVSLEANRERNLEVNLVEGNAPPGMVLIPEGEFIFGVDEGSPDERPKQSIYLKGYYIDRYETTNRQWSRVFPNHVFEAGLEDHPVVGISWREAVAYAKVIGKRLPTELEWEKAARGTDGRDWPWGNQFNKRYCNCAETQQIPVIQAVGQFREGTSIYGCFDMAGNALEWTSSWYQSYPGNEDISVEYGQLYKSLRGGAFHHRRSDVRVTRRFFDTPDAKKADYGLRLVADLDAVLPTAFEPIEELETEDSEAEEEPEGN